MHEKQYEQLHRNRACCASRDLNRVIQLISNPQHNFRVYAPYFFNTLKVDWNDFHDGSCTAKIVHVHIAGLVISKTDVIF